MADTSTIERCRMGCKWAAGGVGLLALILMAALWGWSVFLSLVIAVAIGAALWFGLPKLVCDENASPSAAAAPPPGRASSDPRPDSSAAETGPEAGAPVAGGEEPSRRMGASEAEAPAQSEPARPERAADSTPDSPVAPSGEEPRPADPAFTPDAKPDAPASEPVSATGAVPETAAPVSAAMEEVPEGAEEKPEALSEPRAGRADDLKLIRGIGPKLEQTLHGLGIYHYDQIAAWSPREAAWVDRHLEGFRGRVTRDDWVAQAKSLLQG